MKTTPFTEKHKALGAKMHEFAGFEMPIEYSGILDEHMTVLNGVGVFDVSHMGEIWVTGRFAIPFLQKVTSNDVSKLTPGKAQYSCFPNETGGVVDDLIVYCFDSEKFLLVVNASNIEKDWNWLLTHNQTGANLENASDKFGQLAVQGPKAKDVIQRLTNVDLSTIPYYHFAVGELAGIKDVIISNTGYTGAGGFELYFKAKDAMKVWDAVFEAGAPEGIKPIGLGARDTLRLESGFNLYGNDMDDTTSPLEAGLGWITKFVDNKPFINRAALEAQKAEGVKRRLVAFKLTEKGIPRHGYIIENEAGEEIGHVTSGSISPSLNIGIGMGYVATPYAKVGTPIKIRIRNKAVGAEVAKPPFRP
jgi:aminomethyltransferase